MCVLLNVEKEDEEEEEEKDDEKKEKKETKKKEKKEVKGTCVCVLLKAGKKDGRRELLK